MRNFNTSDIFQAARIIKKYDIKEIIKPLAKMGEQKNVDIEDLGLEAVVTILSDEKSEKAFYEIVALPFEMDYKEIANIDIDVLLEKIEGLNLLRFFKLAGQLNLK